MIGARIKEIRTKKRITQEKLSERMEINPKYLSRIEQGKENPTLNTFIRMSESLDVELGEIFKLVRIEDPKNRRSLINSLLKEADSEQLKLIYKILSVLIH